MNFVFDVDGTLTPPRSKMSKEFKEFFLEWMKDKQVYLLTGSDKDKTISQVGQKIWEGVTAVHQTCGNEVWTQGKLVYENKWEASDSMMALFNDIVNKSKYPERHGNHVEVRTGMVNVSTVGRNATTKQREDYVAWDATNKEREHWCKVIKRIHRYTLDASVGGEISIDVHPIGKDKSQILDDLFGEVHFFGDKCGKGGNDYPLAIKMKGSIQHHVHQVKGPEHTRKLIERY